MAVDQELSALASVASLLPTDIFYLVRDPGGGAEADNKAPVSVMDARYASASQGALADTALQNAALFATAAQGALADTALQAAAIGVSVQAYDAGLAAITAFGRSLIDDVDAAAGRATLIAAGTGVSNLFTARQDIRASGAGIAAGLHVPWVSGDALPTIYVGLANINNNQVSIHGQSYSSSGGRFQSTTGVAAVGISSSGTGGQFSSSSSLGLSAQSNTATPVDAIQLTGANTAINDLLVIRKRPLSTAGAGFGAATVYKLSSSTTADQLAGRLSYLWAEATHASRKARSLWTVYDTAEREAIRIEADGSAAMVGFLGATALPRQTIAAAATDPATTMTLVNDLRAKLISFGLLV